MEQDRTWIFGFCPKRIKKDRSEDLKHLCLDQNLETKRWVVSIFRSQERWVTNLSALYLITIQNSQLFKAAPNPIWVSQSGRVRAPRNDFHPRLGNPNSSINPSCPANSGAVGPETGTGRWRSFQVEWTRKGLERNWNPLRALKF